MAENARSDAQRFHAVARADDLPEGQTRVFCIDGRSIVVCRHQQRIYAVENRCPHQGRELAGALLRRGEIICPHHGARFDLASGAALGPTTTCPLPVFETRVVDGTVEVSVLSSYSR